MFGSKKDLWTEIITSSRRSLTDLSSNIKKNQTSMEAEHSALFSVLLVN